MLWGAAKEKKKKKSNLQTKKINLKKKQTLVDLKLINFKKQTDLNVKCKTTKLLEKNTGQNLQDLGLSKQFLAQKHYL